MATYLEIIKILKNKRDPQLPQDKSIIPTLLSYISLDWRHRVCGVCGDVFHIDSTKSSFHCELCKKHYHSSCTTKFVREIHDFQTDDSFEQIICPHHKIRGKARIERKMKDATKRIEFDNENVICLVDTDMDIFRPSRLIDIRCRNCLTPNDNTYFWNLFECKYQCRNCISIVNHHDQPEDIDTEFHNYNDIQFNIFCQRTDQMRLRRDEIFVEVYEDVAKKQYFRDN